VDEHNTVLTVPLDFDANQRKIATKAAEAAGFKVVQVRIFFILSSPSITLVLKHHRSYIQLVMAHNSVQTFF
jgi:methenyltetrahydromethanopterin cyclohydrolase